ATFALLGGANVAHVPSTRGCTPATRRGSRRRRAAGVV
ncbi:MAG: hypothetical protein AVDCRST_MAG12-3363, partial [uncultured Rubrobacteraceae bacterium]